MGGGLIQIVAYGVEDLFITSDPEITYFKTVYKRHTNFSTEPIPQKFIQPLDWGRKSTCIIPRQGDLIGRIFLCVKLPAIKPETDSTTSPNKYPKYYAWARKIGFAMIKTCEVVIGSEMIDRQYGEWLNVWYSLLTKPDEGYDKMIGNIPELYEPSESKPEYLLYIPLQFWFCRNSGSFLPLIGLSYSEVKINIELNTLDKCLEISPGYWIELANDLVNLQKFEYIEQNYNGTIAAGRFIHWDIFNKRAYYTLITKNNFLPMVTNNSGASGTNPLYLLPGAQLNQTNTTNSNIDSRYFITGQTSSSFVIPVGIPRKLNIEYSGLALPDNNFLLITYVFLDEEERGRFMSQKHDYLIEQVLYIDPQVIPNRENLLNIKLFHPCKFVVWLTQLDYLETARDYFNYTDSYKYAGKTQLGKSLVKSTTLLINNRERVSNRTGEYFNWIQPYQCFPYGTQEGFNVYSFALYADKVQPSGTCNMSQIDNIQINLTMGTMIGPDNKAKCRGYSLVYNILRITNGLGGIVFN